MLDGGEGGGVSAVDPALLEVPERRNDQVIPPGWGKPVLGPAWLQLDLVTDQLQNIRQLCHTYFHPYYPCVHVLIHWALQ